MATLSEGLAHLLQRMELPVHVAMLASNGSGHLARYTLNLDGSAHSEFFAELLTTRVKAGGSGCMGCCWTT